MESISISVITVTYNNIGGLKKTIESYRGSTPSDHRELIVVDGGSKDGTREYLEEIRNTSTPNFHFLSEKDDGIYDAMNKGVTMSQGQWIVFMNAGDQFYEPNTLNGMEELSENDVCDAIYGDSQVNYHGFSRIQKAMPVDFRKALPCVHQSFYCRKGLLVEHPFNKQYELCADYDFYLWLVSSGKRILRVKSVLSKVTAGGTSDERRAAASLEKLKIHSSYFGTSLAMSLHFYSEYVKGSFVTFIKSVLPHNVIHYFTKLKYRND